MQIRFSTKSFGVDAAEVAARAIENIAGTLVDADMRDIIAGRPGGWRFVMSVCCCAGGGSTSAAAAPYVGAAEAMLASAGAPNLALSALTCNT